MNILFIGIPIAIVVILAIAASVIIPSVRRSRELDRKSEEFVENIRSKQGHQAQLRALFHYLMDYELVGDEALKDAEARELFQKGSFVYKIDHYYIQGYKDGQKIHCEVTGNEYLPDGKKLDDQQIQQLLAFGWKLSEEDGNYEITVAGQTKDDLAALVALLDKTLRVYGVSEDSVTHVEMMF